VLAIGKFSDRKIPDSIRLFLIGTGEAEILNNKRATKRKGRTIGFLSLAGVD